MSEYYITGKKEEFYFSQIDHGSYLKLVLVCLIMPFLSLFMFLGSAYYLISNQWRNLSDLLSAIFCMGLGGVFLFISVPLFFRLTYIGWIHIQYLRACEAGDEDQIQRRTEPTLRAFLTLKEWIFVVQTTKLNSLPPHDMLRAADNKTAVLAANNDLLKRRNVRTKQVIKTSELLDFLSKNACASEAIRFATFAGYSEFSKELVMQLLAHK